MSYTLPNEAERRRQIAGDGIVQQWIARGALRPPTDELREAIWELSRAINELARAVAYLRGQTETMVAMLERRAK